MAPSSQARYGHPILHQTQNHDPEPTLPVIYSSNPWQAEPAQWSNGYFPALDSLQLEPRSPDPSDASLIPHYQKHFHGSSDYFAPLMTPLDTSKYDSNFFSAGLCSTYRCSVRHPSPEETMTMASIESLESTFTRCSSDNYSPSPVLTSSELRWAAMGTATPEMSWLAESSYGSEDVGVALRDIQSSHDGSLDQSLAESFCLETRFDPFNLDSGTSYLHSDYHGSTTTTSNSTLFSSSTSRSSIVDDEEDEEYTPGQNMYPRTAAYKAHETRIAKRYKSMPATRKSRQHRKAIVKQVEKEESVDDNAGEATVEKIRPYSCPLGPYGCPAVFASKNEWKRHLVSQHLCPGYYRCDLCSNQDRDPNDFNRKDLFIQHLRRMHCPAKGQKVTSRSDSRAGSNGMEHDFEVIRERCYVPLHSEDLHLWCVFCSRNFSGEKSCEEWIEHIAKHLSESAKDATAQGDILEAPWAADSILRHWLLAEGLIEAGSFEGTWQLVPPSAALERRSRALDRKNRAILEESRDAEGDEEE